MTEQDINKIKSLFPEWEIKCTLTENGILIEHKPRKPLYVDPDNGDEFFEFDECFFFNKRTYGINCLAVTKNIIFAEKEIVSKCYNTREKCELALAEFIARKHGKIVVGGGLNSVIDAINNTYNEPTIQLGVERFRIKT